MDMSSVFINDFLTLTFVLIFTRRVPHSVSLTPKMFVYRPQIWQSVFFITSLPIYLFYNLFRAKSAAELSLTGKKILRVGFTFF